MHITETEYAPGIIHIDLDLRHTFVKGRRYSDSGVCALAMASDRSYEDVCEATFFKVGPKGERVSWWTTTCNMSLIKYGAAHLSLHPSQRRRKVSSWEDVPSHAIVRTERIGDISDQHWVWLDRHRIVWDSTMTKLLPIKQYPMPPIECVRLGVL